MENKNVDFPRLKLIYFALLETAMKYKESTWRNDLTGYKESITAFSEQQEKGQTPTKQRKLEQKLFASVLSYEQKITKFNEAACLELDEVRANFQQPSDTSFKDYSDRMGLILEEFVNAKNTGDFLLMCKAYNLGLLDQIVEEMRKVDIEPPIIVDEEK